MRIEVWLKGASQPLLFEGVTNTYEKGSFYCIYWERANKVEKYPIADIFRVIETYKVEG